MKTPPVQETRSKLGQQLVAGAAATRAGRRRCRSSARGRGRGRTGRAGTPPCSRPGALQSFRDFLHDHVPRQPGERELEHAVVVARVARHRAVRERLAGVVLVVDEAGVADPVRDLVAVGVDAGDARVVGREQRRAPSRARPCRRGCRTPAGSRTACRSARTRAIVVLSGLKAKLVPELRAADETNDATCAICVARELARRTRACRSRRCAPGARRSTASGFSSSRFGPTWPFAPAALSVWQPAAAGAGEDLRPG